VTYPSSTRKVVDHSTPIQLMRRFITQTKNLRFMKCFPIFLNKSSLVSFRILDRVSARLELKAKTKPLTELRQKQTPIIC